MLSHLKSKLFNICLQDIKKKKPQQTSIRSWLSSHTQELNELFIERIILSGQPGRSFEVGKATCFWTPAGLFLASKFAANSVVEGISESFLFLDFPLAHHSFFHFCAEGLEFIAVPIWGCGEAHWGEPEVLWSFLDWFKGIKLAPLSPNFHLHVIPATSTSAQI